MRQDEIALAERHDAVHSLLEQLRAAAPKDMGKIIDGVATHIDHLTDEISAIKFAQSDPGAVGKWSVYGMTQREIQILEMLDRAGTRGCTLQALMSGSYAGRSSDEWPSDKIITVHICKIRAKLFQHNAPFHIETVWGVGFVLKDGASKVTPGGGNIARKFVEA